MNQFPLFSMQSLNDLILENRRKNGEGTNISGQICSISKKKRIDS